MFWLGKSMQSDSKDIKGLSPIEFIVLAHLRNRELRNAQTLGQYGYEMINELNQMFAGSWEAKSGTIYPILSKLDTEKEYIRGENKPSPLGPTKKVYELTDKGRQLIDNVVRANYKSDIEFILHYFELLSPFMHHFDNDETGDHSSEQFYQIPVKAIALMYEHNTTAVDQEIKNHKLEAMKANVENILRNIENELMK